jgi:hypothetical protein
MPTRSQQQALLRIHRSCLTRTDLEEVGVEFVDGGKKRPLADIGLPAAFRIRVV